MAATKLSPYEQARLDNIARNAKVLKQMGLSDIHRDIKSEQSAAEARSQAANKQRAVQRRKAKMEQAKRRRKVPPRRSKRLKGLDAEGGVLPEKVPARSYADHVVEREEITGNIDVDADGMEFLKLLEKEDGGKGQRSVLKHAETMGKLTVASSIKLTPQRIYSCSLSPSSSSVVIAAGDKVGWLGLWMPPRDGGGDGVMDRTRIASTVVSHTLWSNTQQLYASCYDGRIVRLDAQKSVFTEVVSNPGTGFFSLDADASSHCIYASDEDGYVTGFDVRAGMKSVLKFEAHAKKTNTVSLNPVSPHIVATASLDRSVALWDLRKVSGGNGRKAKPTKYMPQGLSVNCALFNPAGDQVCVLEMNNRIKIYDTLGEKRADVYHNNRTGRWLTKFKPAWASPTSFFTGSMEQPRCVELWSSQGDELKMIMRLRDESVQSVQSLMATNGEVLATANASGKIYFWK